MSQLDEPALYALDREDMFGHIRALGSELINAWDASAEMCLPKGVAHATGVVVAGMGGSATGGDYFAALCQPTATIPVVVIRGYELPNWVSERTLVVVATHSGNTAEALSCYHDARRRGAMLLVLTMGGELAECTARDHVAIHHLTYDAPPRAALAHSLAPLLRVGTKLELCDVGDAAVRSAGEQHSALVDDHIGPSQPTKHNGSKQLAESLDGRFVMIFAAEHLTSVARRFRNQLSENGKTLGSFEMLPEANHNFVVGLGTATGIAGSLAAVMLESRLYDDRVRRRFDVTADLLTEVGIPVRRVELGGATILEQLLQGTAWGDYTSCYLGLLNGFDPTPIPQIDRLKAALRGV